MKKEELIRQLYTKKEQKRDKNWIFLERTKVYFIIQLVQEGILTSEKASEIFARHYNLQEFIELIRPRVEEIDIALMEKLIEKF